MGAVSLEAALDLALDLLEREGLRPFLWGGTLLGAVREGRLLPWDGDVDLGLAAEECPVPLLDGSPLVRVRHPLSPQHVEVGMLQANVGLHLHGVKVGLHVMHPAGGERYYSFLKRTVRVPEVLPLRESALGGRRVLLPRDPEAQLDWLYGDWHTVVREYNRSPEERARQAEYLL